jgi:hypothetical protein
MFKKVFVFGILIALVLASFPTLGVLAGGPEARVVKMEANWDQYVTAVKKIAFTHVKVDFIAKEWLADHPKTPDRNKFAVETARAGFHQNLDAAQAIIAQHSGFDAKGKVIEVAAASKSVKHLGEHLALLRGYWHTMTNLDTHLKD